jgi:hypothetical protein
MKLGKVVTGSGNETLISLNYMPANLHFAAGTQFTSLKVEVVGDGVIADLDADGIDYVSRQNRVAGLDSMIPLANGLVRKTTTIRIVNSAAQTPDIYGYSKNKANIYMRSIQQKVLSGSGQDFDNFFTLGLPNFVSSDDLNITYRNQFNQKFSPDDLRADNSFRYDVKDDKFDFYINNDHQKVKSVNFIPNADQQVYLQKFIPIGNVKG